LDLISADAPSVPLPTSPRKNVRSWILLVLALVPIFGALIGSAAFWQSDGDKLDGLASQSNTIDISFHTAAFIDDFQAAYFAIQDAAANPQNAEAQLRAEDRRDRALTSVEIAANDTEPLARAIATEFGVDPEFFKRSLVPVFESSAAALSDQIVGEPASEPMRDASTTITTNLQGRFVSGTSSIDSAVNATKEVLFGFLTYQTNVGKTMSTLLPAALDPVVPEAEFAELLQDTSDITSTPWTDTRFRIEFLPEPDTFTLRLGSQLDPMRSLVATSTSKRQFADQAQGLLDELAGNVANAHRLSADAIAAKRTDLKTKQTRAALVGTTMVMLTLTLLRMAWLEVGARKHAQQLHVDAIQKLDDQVRTDPLTGARNRRHINQVLQDRLDCQDTDGQVLLAYLDLDRFKALNDVWGHSVGDQLLKIVTRRLSGVSFRGVSPEVVRFGGDEFVCFVQLNGLQTIDAVQFGQALIDAVRPPVRLAGRAHNLSATAGLSVSNEASSPHTLILEADTSLIDAKRTHRGSLLLYNRHISQTSELLNRLPNAMANREIRCHLQPVYDIATGELVHAEALARWQPPGEEMIMPGKFIHLVETFGMAALLTTAVLEEVAAIISERLIPDHTTVWINAAPVELESHEFADRLLADIDRLGLQGRIGLEITETAAIADPVHFASQTSQLREAGVSIAIDDFGSGYSPLGLLQDLPIDVVKLDRTLISHIDTKPGHQELVRGIIALIHEQGRSIIAEGVERDEELDWLHIHGVEAAQGYLLAPPMDPRCAKLPSTCGRNRTH